ncbi:MAG: hypothetical protein ACRD3R_07065 [Terriglobales bacterium]
MHQEKGRWEVSAMWNCIRAMLMVVIAFALQLSPPGAAAASAKARPGEGPAYVEPVPGTELKRLKLVEKAVRRLDIQTGQVREQSGKKIAPYSAVIYDLDGVAWVYINPEPRTYVRRRIVVESIDGDKAYLKEGPPAGTEVVTVGVSELYGAEKGVGH